jgi:nucleotide-binding universal stress UspA family protein
MTSGRIVVGVDGSVGSKKALQWAVEEAKLRGAKVDAVQAWSFPYYGEVAAMAAVAVDGTELERAAAASLAAVVEALAPDPAAGGVVVEQHVHRGDAASALLRAAEEADADLLVVGSRGHGGFTGLLLGSVSQQCVHHASCPVVVVREEHRS